MTIVGLFVVSGGAPSVWMLRNRTIDGVAAVSASGLGILVPPTHYLNAVELDWCRHVLVFEYYPYACSQHKAVPRHTAVRAPVTGAPVDSGHWQLNMKLAAVNVLVAVQSCYADQVATQRYVCEWVICTPHVKLRAVPAEAHRTPCHQPTVGTVHM